LIAIRRVGNPTHVARHDYYLLEAGREAARRIVDEYPQLTWYSERAALVARVAAHWGGKALKARQYEQSEYAGTALGNRITSIVERVRARAQVLLARE
jgi:hypothetical protein